MALARKQDDVTANRIGKRSGNCGSAVPDLACGRRSGEDCGADPGRVLASGIVVGDNDEVASGGGDPAHGGALAFVAVSARTEQGDQPTLDMRTKCGDCGFERVGCVGIIDIDGRS